MPNVLTFSAGGDISGNPPEVALSLLLTDGAGGFNFTDSLYLVLDSSQSREFVQYDVTQGEYVVMAFDIERDGRPWSSPAVQESVVVIGDG